MGRGKVCKGRGTTNEDPAVAKGTEEVMATGTQ